MWLGWWMEVSQMDIMVWAQELVQLLEQIGQHYNTVFTWSPIISLVASDTAWPLLDAGAACPPRLPGRRGYATASARGDRLVR